MRKIPFLMALFLIGCSPEPHPDCSQRTGKIQWLYPNGGIAKCTITKSIDHEALTCMSGSIMQTYPNGRIWKCKTARNMHDSVLSVNVPARTELEFAPTGELIGWWGGSLDGALTYIRIQGKICVGGTLRTDGTLESCLTMESRKLCYSQDGTRVNNKLCTEEKEKRKAEAQTYMDKATRIVAR